MAAGRLEELPPERMSRFVPMSLSKPVLAAAVGIDGGALFQILAIEDLGLSPAAIGIAFGLGLVSLPLQMWAARMPLRFARRNVQMFLVFVALQCVVLAWLVAIGAAGGLAATALVVTVTAEVAISVLFVTAWQPLLSTRVQSHDRQRINAGWSALGRGLLAGLLVVFSAVNSGGRALVLVALAVLAVGVALHFRRVAVPDEPSQPSAQASPPTTPQRISPVMWWILGSIAALHLGALPLWLVYLHEVMWPTVNLGAIGAIQTLAIVAALLAWRSTAGGLERRAMTGAILVVAGSIALVGVGRVADHAAEQVTVLLATVAMSFGVTYTSLALLEMAHRLVDSRQSVVRMFTILDVVDSSALQLGLLVGGFLVTVSAHELSWAPYVTFLVTMSTVALLAVWNTIRLAGSPAADDRGAA